MGYQAIMMLLGSFFLTEIMALYNTCTTTKTDEAEAPLAAWKGCYVYYHTTLTADCSSLRTFYDSLEWAALFPSGEKVRQTRGLIRNEAGQ